MPLFIRGKDIATNQVAEPAKGGVVITEEPVWSENTGRDVNTGKMIGDIVAWKKTVSITWPPLTFAQTNKILNLIGVGNTSKSPFFKIYVNDRTANKIDNPQTFDPAEELTEITVYSSNLSKTIESISNAYKRQTGVTVTFIEQ